MTPIISVRDDRDNNKVEMEQLRIVGGIRGDLPAWQNNKGLGNWGYDVYYSHSTSEGTDIQTGILEDPLTLSLETSVIDADGNITCGDGAPCVPINMFAGSLYQPGGGTFGSQAETDFVFGIRSFNTEVEQSVFSGVLQGDVAELPWNNTTIPLVVGFEWREDVIDSKPNNVARDGGFIAFFKDAGAKGDRSITELFVETELQLLEDVKYAEDLSLNVAMRWTDESTYGDDTTYSVKSVYTPIEGVTFRGTYGTSFRAPNANEQFLAGQSGFTTVFDPCIIPSNAVIPALDPNVPGTYDPSNDNRSQTIMDNCAANGVDPTTLGLNGTLSQYSVEVLRKGGQQVQLEIDPETSTSYTYGVVLDQPFWDEFTLRFGVTVYDIEVEDSISLLGTGFIVNDCYVENANNSSAFCRFINRDDDGLIDVVDSSFVNINQISSAGIDYNLYYQRDFIVADRNLDLQVDLRMTRVMENLFSFEDIEEDDAGTPVAPEWEGTLLVTANYGDFRFNWRSNYISGEQDTREAFANNPACSTLSVLCRPIAKTDYYYWNHTASVTWSPRDWTLTVGIVNLTDQDPPLMDNAAPETQLNNVPLGAGYDMLGRRVFASVSKRF